MARKTARPKTNITAEHKQVFSELQSEHWQGYALVSCFVDGEAASAITRIGQDPVTGFFLVQPLFVSVTPGMVITDHEGREPV